MTVLVGVLMALGVVVVVAIGWLAVGAAGPVGLAVLAGVLLLVASVAIRLRIALPHVVLARAESALPSRNADFPSYRELASTLHWSNSSRHHFDRITRPRLWRLVVLTAEDRHGASGADVERLRATLGPQLWPLVDPNRPAWTDPLGERERGPDAATLARLTDRIERI